MQNQKNARFIEQLFANQFGQWKLTRNKYQTQLSIGNLYNPLDNVSSSAYYKKDRKFTYVQISSFSFKQFILFMHESIKFKKFKFLQKNHKQNHKLQAFKHINTSINMRKQIIHIRSLIFYQLFIQFAKMFKKANLILLNSTAIFIFILFCSLQFCAKGQSENRFPTFDNFILKYNKTYTENQYSKRQQIYAKNLKQIQVVNKTYFGVNFYTDWTIQEFQKLTIRTMAYPITKLSPTEANNDAKKQDQAGHLMQGSTRLLTQTGSDVPGSFDWRQKIKMPSIKHQGECGDCYAFSSTSFFQSDSIIKDSANEGINLSEQYLVSCDELSNGCDGGQLYSAMDLVLKRGGMPYQSDYPFSPNQKQPKDICTTTNIFKLPAQQTLRYTFQTTDQQSIIKQVLIKPLNVELCGYDLKNYSPESDQIPDRTLKCEFGFYIDHSALLIGYTEDEWIIQNSWGVYWGLGGYGYISRKQGQDCCIGSQIHTTKVPLQSCAIQDCLKCLSSTYCGACKESSFFVQVEKQGSKEVSQVCQKCEIINCLKCFDYWGDCQKCLEGYSYYPVQQQCRQTVIQHCTYMIDSNCYECEKGFILAPDYLECMQNCEIKNCKDCDQFGESCIQCVNGHYLKQYQTAAAQKYSLCERYPCLIQNCRLCNQHGDCIQCHDMYQKIDQGYCQKSCAWNGCLFCVPFLEYCLQCEEGKSLNYWSNECEQHQFPNCQQFGFYKQYECELCKSSYRFNDDFTECYQTCTISKCIKCETEDLSQCLECQSGYYVHRNLVNGRTECLKYTCLQTLSQGECLKCDSKGDCLSCSQSNYLYDSQLKHCYLPCQIKNCAKCEDVPFYCQQCQQNYQNYLNFLCYIPNDKKCMQWLPNSNQKQCIVCEQGYAPVNISNDSPQNGFQVVCKLICSDEYCDICAESHEDSCQACHRGYRLVEQESLQGDGSTIMTCRQNDPSKIPYCVLISEDEKTCYECLRHFFFISVDGVTACHKVASKDANCQRWNQNGDCLLCKSFYDLNITSARCVKQCPLQNCLNCPEGSDYEGRQCVLCEQGFSIELESRVCNLYDFPNCLEYQDNPYYGVYCGKCVEGSSFNSLYTKCIQECDVDYCEKCDHEDLDTCLKCEKGYALKEQDGTLITSCQKYPCTIKGCRVCDVSGKCLQCRSTADFLNNKTNQCQLFCGILHCETCASRSTCGKCEQPYLLYNSQYCYLQNDKNCVSFVSSYENHTDMGCLICQIKYQLLFVINQMEPVCRMIACSDVNCRRCDPNVNRNICTVCITGFKLAKVSDQVTKCEKIVSMIRNCLLGSENQTYCYYCIKFHFFNSTSNECEPQTRECDINCEMCSTNAYYDYKCVCVSPLIFSNDDYTCVPSQVSSKHCIQVQYKRFTQLCTQCAVGYVPSAENTYCRRHCDVQNCQTCIKDSKTECLNCAKGYYKQNFSKCTSCEVQRCAQCRLKSTCLKCQPNFTVQKQLQTPTDLNSLTVYTCVPGSCPNNMVLVQGRCACSSGTYLNQGESKCYTCAGNCKACSAVSCSECSEGFYLSQKNCLNCQENCLKCSASTDCQACRLGYTFSTPTKKCLQDKPANDSTTIIDTNQIYQCSANNCLNCSKDFTLCSQCQLSYALADAGKACVACQVGCSRCEYTNATLKCTECSQNYFIDLASCKLCSENCSACAKASNQCTNCSLGFYLENNACKGCSQNCSKCDSLSKCTQCLPGFALMSNGTCQKCLVDCLKCNPNVLYECIPTCIDGFYLNQSNCQKCPANCTSCESSQKCNLCQSGYVIINNLCSLPCQQGCSSCDPKSTSNCLKCFGGYALQSKNLTCLPNVSCNDNKNCLTCPNKYSLRDKVCQKCLTLNCIKCNSTNLSSCLQCSAGLYLSTSTSAQCTSCPTGCRQCQDASRCISCLYGYFLKQVRTSQTFNAICSKCYQNCTSCSSYSGKCLSCIEGYELDLNKDKCLSKQRIELVLKLDIAFSQFGKYYQSIKKGLLQMLGTKYQTKPEYIMIKSIKQGSTVVQSQLVVPSGQSSNQMLNNVKSKLQSSSLANIPIISVEKLSTTTNPTNDNNSNNSNNNNSNQQSSSSQSSSGGSNVVTIAVASSIAGVIVIVLIAIGIWWVVKKKKSSAKYQSQSANNEVVMKQDRLSENEKGVSSTISTGQTGQVLRNSNSVLVPQLNSQKHLVDQNMHQMDEVPRYQSKYQAHYYKPQRNIQNYRHYQYNNNLKNDKYTKNAQNQPNYSYNRNKNDTLSNESRQRESSKISQIEDIDSRESINRQGHKEQANYANLMNQNKSKLNAVQTKTLK